MVIIMIADEQSNQALIHHMMRTLVEQERAVEENQEPTHEPHPLVKLDHPTFTPQVQMFSVHIPATSTIAHSSKPSGAYKDTQDQEEMGQDAGRIRPLTDREREILNLMRKGQKNREIAIELSIAESTVHKHIQNIFEKLHARNRTEAIYLTSGH